MHGAGLIQLNWPKVFSESFQRGNLAGFAGNAN
jgi:hypothetical protein